MGLGGISVWQLLIVLLIVMMLFGTKRLRGLGSDLGAAIRGFKSSMDTDPEKKAEDEEDNAEVVEGEENAAQLKEQDSKS